jgi:glutamine amidotransferase
MDKSIKPKIAIVNYGLGNLFSVKNACEIVGLKGSVTSSKIEIRNADAVILPGVGAFGDAMNELRRLDLIEVLEKAATSSKPFIGICLGMQLLMEESFEFGHHRGLEIIKGSVVRFQVPLEAGKRKVKIPQVGWNRIYKVPRESKEDSWANTLLAGVADGEFMYYVHSYYVKPKNEDRTLSLSDYAGIHFCSSLKSQDIFACQYHPERSGSQGLRIYKNLLFYLN